MPTAIRRRRSPALPTIVGVALIVASLGPQVEALIAKTEAAR